MSKVTSRFKLGLVVILFVVFCGAMFGFGYNILEQRNEARIEVVMAKGIELEVMQRERRNFDQGQRDLASLTQKAYPPQDLFSRDTRIVNEIRILEELASRYSLSFNLSVAGTSDLAPKVEGVSAELIQIPYSVTVTGSFNNILRYIEAAEHTSFINRTQAIELAAEENGRTRAEINSLFFLRP